MTNLSVGNMSDPKFKEPLQTLLVQHPVTLQAVGWGAGKGPGAWGLGGQGDRFKNLFGQIKSEYTQNNFIY